MLSVLEIAKHRRSYAAKLGGDPLVQMVGSSRLRTTQRAALHSPRTRAVAPLSVQVARLSVQGTLDGSLHCPRLRGAAGRVVESGNIEAYFKDEVAG
eukprot:1790841-Amphidinium_carterae.2